MKRAIKYLYLLVLILLTSQTVFATFEDILLNKLDANSEPTQKEWDGWIDQQITLLTQQLVDYQNGIKSSEEAIKIESADNFESAQEVLANQQAHGEKLFLDLKNFYISLRGHPKAIGAYKILRNKEFSKISDYLSESRGTFCLNSIRGEFQCAKGFLTEFGSKEYSACSPLARQKDQLAQQGLHNFINLGIDIVNIVTGYNRQKHSDKIGVEKLHKAGLDGDGIIIAIVDFFDRDRLQEQQAHNSKILTLVEKGQTTSGQYPDGDGHGNTIIEITTSIAPNATIVPITFRNNNDLKEVMRYLNERSDISVVNISRLIPFDEESLRLLDTLTQNKLLVKSLGNGGSSINSGEKKAKKASKISNFTKADLADIPTIVLAFSKTDHHPHNLLLVANLNMQATGLAPSSNSPGGNKLIQKYTLAVPSDAIYSDTTQTYESGTSYASPQVAALAALLLQSATKKYGTKVPWKVMIAAVTQAISNTAIRPEDLTQHDVGNGLPQAMKAQRKLFQNLDQVAPHHLITAEEVVAPQK